MLTKLSEQNGKFAIPWGLVSPLVVSIAYSLDESKLKDWLNNCHLLLSLFQVVKEDNSIKIPKHSSKENKIADDKVLWAYKKSRWIKEMKVGQTQFKIMK